MASPSKAASAQASLAGEALGVPMGGHRRGAGASGATNFNDETLYEYFACYVVDPDLRFAMRAELEKRKMETKPKKGAQPAVKLATLRVMPHSFELQWRKKVNTRAGYAWWKRVADGIQGFDASSQYHVLGFTELPSPKRGAASGAEHATAPAAASSAPARPLKRKRFKSSGRSGEACPVPEPSAASAPVPAAQPEPERIVQWPRFKVRRLLGALAGEHGVGGRERDYPLGARLGRGSYGEVFKSSLGGFPSR